MLTCICRQCPSQSIHVIAYYTKAELSRSTALSWARHGMSMSTRATDLIRRGHAGHKPAKVLMVQTNALFSYVIPVDNRLEETVERLGDLLLRLVRSRSTLVIPSSGAFSLACSLALQERWMRRILIESLLNSLWLRRQYIMLALTVYKSTAGTFVLRSRTDQADSGQSWLPTREHYVSDGLFHSRLMPLAETVTDQSSNRQVWRDTERSPSPAVADH